MNRLCAFSTASDNYIPNAVASLLSVRHYNESIPLFVISSRISRKSKKLLDNHDILYIETDLSNTFTQHWEYPIECFYLFAGPQLLKDKGFTHSLYIDGDIYCNADPMIPLNQVEAFAGVTNGTIKQILGDDYKKVLDVWGDKTTAGAEVERLQSGVVYFNNDALSKMNFLDQIEDIFKKSIKHGTPRKGDDSLFALFQFINPTLPYLKLDSRYNHMTKTTSSDRAWLDNDASLIDSVIFYHFTNGFPKPWSLEPTYPSYTYKHFATKWVRRAIDTLSSSELQKYFPDISSRIDPSRLRFYSWPSENVGDLITPYYLEKVCKVSDLKQYTISEEQIMAIESGNTPQKRFFFKRHNQRSGAEYNVSTGSVIRLCGNKAMVYGSGIRSADQEVHASYVRSVRGPLTRNRFLEEGFECPPIYGDPGLLLPRFYMPQTSRKTHKLGILPHFTEYQKVLDLYKGDTNVIVIDMGCGDLEKVIDQLTSCESTVASSLHGLVLSHAYNIPTRRIIFSDGIFGDGTKFTDYYAGIELTPLPYIDASNYTKVTATKLITLKKESLINFKDAQLYDAMFFDENGMRPSAAYMY